MKYHLGEALCAFTGSVWLSLPVSTHTSLFWMQMESENGHYTVWIQMPEATTHPGCTHTVDQTPNIAYSPKYRWRKWVISHRSRHRGWTLWWPLTAEEHVSALGPKLWSAPCLIESVKRRRKRKKKSLDPSTSSPVRLCGGDVYWSEKKTRRLQKEIKDKLFLFVLKVWLCAEDCGKYIRECGRISA